MPFYVYVNMKMPSNLNARSHHTSTVLNVANSWILYNTETSDCDELFHFIDK